MPQKYTRGYLCKLFLYEEVRRIICPGASLFSFAVSVQTGDPLLPVFLLGFSLFVPAFSAPVATSVLAEISCLSRFSREIFQYPAAFSSDSFLLRLQQLPQQG